MNEVTLTDFRCFCGEQTARLAPLTLLVGENSTGKTSFMAMIRALWNVAFQQRSPDFKEAPYDLGVFDEVVCHLGGRSRRLKTFKAGFRITPQAADSRRFRFEVTFGKRGDGMPAPERMRLSDDGSRIEVGVENRNWHVSFRTVGGEWKAADTVQFADSHNESMSPIWHSARPRSGAPSEEDGSFVAGLLTAYQQEISRYDADALYASAPVRSKPLRTYDPWHSTRDSEGDHMPTYLAEMYSRDESRWNALKAALEEVGKDAGLFDEFAIERLSKREGSPFQVKVRRFGSRSKGPWRNLIDVGYGVSQALPVLTELLRSDAPALFLLQQPEVHLHPSAQAALGSVFCRVAAPDRQLVVETQSDYLLDRVRMDVRDRVTALKPDDVSILFFERRDLQVLIHSLRIDEAGNIIDAPRGYRRFFLEETTRSLVKTS